MTRHSSLGLLVGGRLSLLLLLASACGPDTPGNEAKCSENNGGCGDPAFFSCTDNTGAAPTCADVDECASNNGGCGTFASCTNNAGAAPTCADIDECATNNGGCGAFASCTNNASAAPTCADIDECATDNGGCGSFSSCTDNVGAAPTCADLNECATDNGGCGSATFFTCVDNVGAAATCADIDECATDNGGCGNAAFFTCADNEGAAATCADINECATENGGCGSAAFFACTDNVGAAPSCADIDECATDNGGCGSATFFTCADNEGAAPTCADIDECATDNGGCGSATFFTCADNEGAAPTCADIDECATDNGGCGDATYYSCADNEGAAPTCADIDECATDNGGCGDATFVTCADNEGAAPTCADIDECSTDNGGCGDATFVTCADNQGAAPTCADIDECAVNNGGCGDVALNHCSDNDGAVPTCTAIDDVAVFGLACSFSTAAGGSSDCSLTTAPYGKTGLDNYTVLGGQNQRVTLAANSVAYDSGTELLTFSATVENLLWQTLGTIDDVTLDSAGVRLFLSRIVVTAGTGAISVTNADGTSTFTAPDQSYFQFDEMILMNETSSPRTVALNVPSSVETFTAYFLVSSQVAVKLVINEVLANPVGTLTDVTMEWFEVFNAGLFPVNMAGFYIGDTAASGDRPLHLIAGEQLLIEPAGYLVFGNTTNTTDNGGVPVDYAYGSALALANSLDAVRLISPAGYVAGTPPTYVEFERASYLNAAISAQAGISRELKNPYLDNANMDGSNWGDASVTATYGPGGRGTPGAQNSVYIP